MGAGMGETVTRVTVTSRIEAAHSRAAKLVDDQRKVNDRLDAFFREIAEVKELLEAEGSLWDGPRLDPPVEAAYGVWAEHGPRETRLELRGIRPVPMMEID